MPLITLNDLYDKWKKVSDWVTGVDAVSAPNVKLTGSSVPLAQAIPHVKTIKETVETLVNAVSVIAGGNVAFNLNCTNESEIYLLVNIDQQPWSLQVGAVNDSGGSYTKTMFPARSAMATAYPNGFAPAISLYLGLNFDTATGLTTPATMQEARAIALPPTSSITGRVLNSSAVTGTVTVKIIRVWR